MKTILPQAINTVEEAKKFLTDLYNNGEVYHPEDSAHEIVWHLSKKRIPTFTECEQLDKLMSDIYSLKGNDGRHCEPMIFDPCEFILMLDPDYRKMLQQEANQ